MRRSGVLVVTFVAGSVLLGSCDPIRTESQTPPTAASRPVEKTTCAEATFSELPAGWELSDCRLVPYGPALLGVEAKFECPGDGEGRAILISGGYLDDVLEAYDDLTFDRWREVSGNRAMTFAGSLMTERV